MKITVNEFVLVVNGLLSNRRILQQSRKFYEEAEATEFNVDLKRRCISLSTFLCEMASQAQSTLAWLRDENLAIAHADDVERDLDYSSEDEDEVQVIPGTQSNLIPLDRISFIKAYLKDLIEAVEKLRDEEEIFILETPLGLGVANDFVTRLETYENHLKQKLSIQKEASQKPMPENDTARVSQLGSFKQDKITAEASRESKTINSLIFAKP